MNFELFYQSAADPLEVIMQMLSADQRNKLLILCKGLLSIIRGRKSLALALDREQYIQRLLRPRFVLNMPATPVKIVALEIDATTGNREASTYHTLVEGSPNCIWTNASAHGNMPPILGTYREIKMKLMLDSATDESSMRLDSAFILFDAVISPFITSTTEINSMKWGRTLFTLDISRIRGVGGRSVVSGAKFLSSRLDGDFQLFVRRHHASIIVEEDDVGPGQTGDGMGGTPFAKTYKDIINAWAMPPPTNAFGVRPTHHAVHLETPLSYVLAQQNRSLLTYLAELRKDESSPNREALQKANKALEIRGIFAISRKFRVFNSSDQDPDWPRFPSLRYMGSSPADIIHDI